MSHRKTKIPNHSQVFHRHSGKGQKIAAVNYRRLTTEAAGHVEIGHTST
jgi:hypothetical protein